MSSIQVARCIVSFSWVYHGIFPKLVHIAPLEKLMTSSLGFSESMSDLMTKSAGVSEIAFGVLLFVLYKYKPIIILNIVALLVLLSFVVIFQPQLLIEAFNPVTTNISIIGLSLVWLNALKKTTIR